MRDVFVLVSLALDDNLPIERARDLVTVAVNDAMEGNDDYALNGPTAEAVFETNDMRLIGEIMQDYADQMGRLVGTLSQQDIPGLATQSVSVARERVNNIAKDLSDAVWRQ